MPYSVRCPHKSDVIWDHNDANKRHPHYLSRSKPTKVFSVQLTIRVNWFYIYPISLESRIYVTLPLALSGNLVLPLAHVHGLAVAQSECVVHDGRSYSAPRTVCSTSGSPADSSLTAGSAGYPDNLRWCLAWSCLACANVHAPLGHACDCAHFAWAALFTHACVHTFL